MTKQEREDKRTEARAWRAQHIERGLCTYCNRVSEGHRMCSVHRRYFRVYMRERRAS